MPVKFVETYRPAYPETGVKFRVHGQKGFSFDCLSPDMTAAFQVDGVKTPREAIAACLEKLAGIDTDPIKVTKMLG